MDQWNSSVGLSVGTLTRIASLGAEIALDIHGPNTDDEDRIEIVEADS
jgi:hypothetical protein